MPLVETKAAPSISYPDPAMLELFGIVPVTSGVDFSPALAMKCTAARCAVQAISEAIGALPVHTFALAPDGTRERDRGHPNDRFLNVAANSWMPAAEFREALTRDCLLWGSGFGFINRSTDGRILELLRLAPGQVSVQIDLATGEPSYLVADRVIAAVDMVHIRAPYVYWPLQQSPTYDAREAIGLALVLEQHAAQLFASGARPSGVISMPKAATPSAMGNIKAMFAAAHSGRNAGGTAVIDNGATFTATTFTSVDAEFMAQRRFAIEEVARAYRVPPVLLMEYGRATWGNSEEMNRQFLTYSLMPWIKRWEGEIGLKLFSAAEQTTHFAEFNTSDLLRADTVQRFEAYSKAVAARIFNPNEVRELENRAPYEGGNAFINPAIQTADVGR